MITQLSRSYASCFGKPVVHAVDTEIFSRTYCSDCMGHERCSDICCQYGADIDIHNIRRIEQHAEALELYTKTSRTEWFHPELTRDEDFPGELYTRTRVKDGRCVFLNRNGRGCMVHSWCLENNIDFRILKPMVSSMFPVTFHEGRLCVPTEVLDGSLFCLGDGTTLYRGARGDLRFFFGDDLISELDALERKQGSAEVHVPESAGMA